MRQQLDSALYSSGYVQRCSSRIGHTHILRTCGSECVCFLLLKSACCCFRGLHIGLSIISSLSCFIDKRSLNFECYPSCSDKRSLCIITLLSLFFLERKPVSAVTYLTGDTVPVLQALIVFGGELR